MHESNPLSTGISRRSFMKKTALATGAVMVLTKGYGLATEQGEVVSGPKLAIVWEIKGNPSPMPIAGDHKATAAEAIKSLKEKMASQLLGVHNSPVTNTSGMVNVQGMTKKTTATNLGTTPPSAVVINLVGNDRLGYDASTTIPAGQVLVRYYE